MGASEPKWVNPVLNSIGINSLRLKGLHMILIYSFLYYIGVTLLFPAISSSTYCGFCARCFRCRSSCFGVRCDPWYDLSDLKKDTMQPITPPQHPTVKWINRLTLKAKESFIQTKFCKISYVEIFSFSFFHYIFIYSFIFFSNF